MKKYSNFYQPPSVHIINNLHLMGITNNICYKQTKQSLQPMYLPKLTYFIIYHSIKLMTEEYEELNNWYPPRTITDQGEFKKIAMDIILRLQQNHKIPKNFIIDKRSFDDSERCVGILRYLTQFALRHVFINKYGDLVQISISSNNENIDKYYPQILIQNCLVQDDTLQIFEIHIEIAKAQLIQKSTYESFSLPFNYEQIMTFIDYQNQVRNKLSKVPKQLFSENRQLDRIQLIDKLSQIWRTLDMGLQKTDIGSNQFVEGQKQLLQIDEQWQGWLRRLVSNIKSLSKQRQQQQIKNPKKLQNMRKLLSDLKEEVKQLKQFKSDISSIMSMD